MTADLLPARTTFTCSSCGSPVNPENVLSASTALGTMRGHRRQDIRWGIDEEGGNVQYGSREWFTCGPVHESIAPAESILARALRDTHPAHGIELAGAKVVSCPLCFPVTLPPVGAAPSKEGDGEHLSSTNGGRDA